jgi:saccharopine dehydrogenase (NAD+, L-lysine-forming)
MVAPHRIVIIGGYGNTGSRVARLLAARADVQLVLVGRHLDRARALAAELAGTAAHPVLAVGADVRDEGQRRTAFDGATLVIAASSTTDHAGAIARSALAAGADTMDTNLSVPAKLAALQALAPEGERAGRCVITDGGFHPGVPGVLVRQAATLLPGLTDAHVGGAFSIDWRALRFSDATASEFVDELTTMDPETLVDGDWQRSISATRTFDFGDAAGNRRCVPWALQEIRDLPALVPTLRSVGFYIAGFGPVIDYLVMPACLVALRILPSQRPRVGKAFLWALRQWTPRGSWAVLQLEAAAGTPYRQVVIRVSHPDPYALTAIPVVACVEQLLDGPRRPGVWTQASFVEPALFLRRLESLGVDVRVSVGTAW